MSWVDAESRHLLEFLTQADWKSITCLGELSSCTSVKCHWRFPIKCREQGEIWMKFSSGLQFGLVAFSFCIFKPYGWARLIINFIFQETWTRSTLQLLLMNSINKRNICSRRSRAKTQWASTKWISEQPRQSLSCDKQNLFSPLTLAWLIFIERDLCFRMKNSRAKKKFDNFMRFFSKDPWSFRRLSSIRWVSWHGKTRKKELWSSTQFTLRGVALMSHQCWVWGVRALQL